MKESDSLRRSKIIFLDSFYLIGYLFLWGYFRTDLQELFPAFHYQMISIIVDLFFLFVFYLFLHDHIKDQYDRFHPDFRLIISATAVLLGLNYIFSLVITPYSNVNQLGLEEQFHSFPFTVLFYTLITAPVAEEIIFRDLFMTYEHTHPYRGMIISSVLFGFLHSVSSAFRGTDTFLIYLMEYTLFGIVLFYTVKKSGNVIHGMIVHFLVNFLAVISLMAL